MHAQALARVTRAVPASNVVGFNFAAVDAPHRETVREKTAEIHRLRSRMASDYLKIGQHLAAVRQVLPAAKFNAWIRAEFGWKVPSTAFNAIQASEQFQDVDAALVDRFDPSALVQFSRIKTKPEAREEALDLARSGTHVTRQRALQIVARHDVGPEIRPDAMHRLRHALRSVARLCPAAQRDELRAKLLEIVDQVLAEDAGGDEAEAAHAVGALC